VGTTALPSDALVIFGATGNLARKKIFPALYALSKRGNLEVPVIGIASSLWSDAQLHDHVSKSIEESGEIADDRVLATLLGRLRYVGGNYNDQSTFVALATALQSVARPTHYLAIPPPLFATVIAGLQRADLAKQGRVIVEKPFGRDLNSAQQLNRLALSAFREDSIFRIDHYLGKEAIMNLLYFRFANAILEPIWHRDYIASVQVSVAEVFGVEDRGSFYENAGCLRDMIQNHLFQIVALLAMEPPAGQSYNAIHCEKRAVFEAMRPLRHDDVVRGQYEGYLREPGVANDSEVETFCALRLHIDSKRWDGVSWYLRSGKCLPATVAEVLIQFKGPSQRLFDDSAPTHSRANYLRFRISPNSAIALAARVKSVGKEYVGQQRELYLLNEQPDAEKPYERLLAAAMAGDDALFTEKESVEAAWAVVDPVLANTGPVRLYPPGSWGPQEADRLLAAHERWNNPSID
jgi:glucose-6-phosphate 1-dehydrogenase